MKSFRILKFSLMILMASAFVLVAKVFPVEGSVSPVLEVSAFEIVLDQSSQATATSEITLSVDYDRGQSPVFDSLDYIAHVMVSPVDQEVFGFSAHYKAGSSLVQNSKLNYMDDSARLAEVTDIDNDNVYFVSVAFVNYRLFTVNLGVVAFLALT